MHWLFWPSVHIYPKTVHTKRQTVHTFCLSVRIFFSICTAFFILFYSLSTHYTMKKDKSAYKTHFLKKNRGWGYCIKMMIKIWSVKLKTFSNNLRQQNVLYYPTPVQTIGFSPPLLQGGGGREWFFSAPPFKYGAPSARRFYLCACGAVVWSKMTVQRKKNPGHHVTVGKIKTNSESTYGI